MTGLEPATTRSTTGAAFVIHRYRHIYNRNYAVLPYICQYIAI